MAFDPKTKPAPEKKENKEVKTNEDVAQNPNPAANENLKDKKQEHKNTNQVGSEITDGEAG